MDNFSFNHDQFNKLFPFHVLLDADNHITSYGKSLAKICSIKIGSSFSEVFILKRPALDSSSIDLSYITDQVVIIESKHNPTIVLRGQFELTHDQSYLLFVGTPWFGSVDQIVENKLSIHDFAIHDPMIDLLHVLKTQEITTNEIKELLTKVNLQKGRIIESEKRISSIILNLQTGILLEDETRHIVLCNKMFCDMFRIPVAPESLKGADCSNAAEQSKNLFKEPDRFAHQISEILRERKMVLSDTLELADGRIFERDYIPIFVSNEYKGHLWKYTDITERKNYERNLKKQEEKYRSIIENMKLGLIEVNLEDEIQYANQNFCDISGYDAEELFQSKTYKILVEDDAFNVVVEKTELRKKGVSDSYELQVKNKSGEPRWWLISGAPNYNDAGDLIGSIGIHLDITEQKNLEEQLRIAKTKAEESSKAKESFLANMSHEIRTPLNAVIGMVRELNKMNPTPQQYTYLKHAGSASQHLLSIINNILDISKIEAGEFHLDNRTFSFQSLVKDTVAIMTSSATDKLLDLTFRINHNLAPAFVGDHNRIKQVLINVLSNSVKFTEKGRITIECTVVRTQGDEQDIKVTISDTGIGMEKSYLKNLFKKFTQEDLSIVRKYGGTGLGMAITYELIQLMGGKIEVTSEKGKGTVFQISLSLKIGNIDEIEKPHTPMEENALSQLKVLLVEDNELNRMVAINTLSYFGVEVMEATNGSEAIMLLKEKPFDLILMDLQMPVMDGLEATRIIREELNLKIPIIALTANAFKNEIEKCMAVGMDDYVTKPFEEKVLAHVIGKNTGRTITPIEEEHAVADSKGEKLYDLSLLKQLSHGDDQFVTKMITMFCASTPPSLETIKSSFHSSNFKMLKSAAHKLKPVIDNMGISSLRSDIRYLEGLDTDKISKSEIEAAISNIEKVINKVIGELNP